MDFNFKPSKEFLKTGKENFLAAFDATYPNPSPLTPRPFGFAFKLLIAVFAVAGLMFGGSIYANAQNVPADSPLYPLKRLAETVQLAFAKTKEKPQLQAAFAARRIHEVSDLEKRASSSAMLPRLTHDLGAAVKASVHDAQVAGLRDGALDDFCGKVLGAVADSSSSAAVRSGLSKHLGRLEETCGVPVDGSSTEE